MPQFDVYRNLNAASRARIPYLLDVQSDLLDRLATRVVVPLCKPDVLKERLAERLNPLFEIEGKKVAMLTPEVAGVPLKILGDSIDNLSKHRNAIVGALDLIVSGI
jgi:toxin CcdB